MSKLCKAGGCERVATHRNFCVKHYHRAVAQGVIFVTPKSAPRTCSVYRCSNPLKAKRLCNAHYKKHLRGVPVYEGKPAYCTFEGCDRPHKGRGFCNGHLMQILRGQELRKLVEVRPGKPRKFIPCSVEGCEKQKRARGYCSTHYSRWLTKGTVEMKPKLNVENSIEDTRDLVSFGVLDQEELVERAGWGSEYTMMRHLPEDLKEKIATYREAY